jgi:hypothetical protein
MNRQAQSHGSLAINMELAALHKSPTSHRSVKSPMKGNLLFPRHSILFSLGPLTLVNLPDFVFNIK